MATALSDISFFIFKYSFYMLKSLKLRWFIYDLIQQQQTLFSNEANNITQPYYIFKLIKD